MENFTIAESYTLPSGGTIYDPPIDPNFTIRSMTTDEEMLRLGKSEKQYKTICDIIDKCIVNNAFNMSSYDMCLADYQFLLHKLRIVTYGSDYKLSSVCPICNETTTNVVNLDDIDVIPYSDEFDKNLTFVLPISKNEIRLNVQTPRMLDKVDEMVKERKRKAKDTIGDPTLLFTVSSLILTVDGTKLDIVKKEEFVRKLPMADTNYILSKGEKLNNSMGLVPKVECECDLCGFVYPVPFRLTREFFSPRVDD